MFDNRHRSVELVVLEAVVLLAVRDELFLVHRFLILIPSLYPRFLHGIQYSSIITASPVRAVVVAVPPIGRSPLPGGGHLRPADRLRRRWRHQLLWLCDRIARIPWVSPHQFPPHQHVPAAAPSYQLAVVVEHVGVQGVSVAVTTAGHAHAHPTRDVHPAVPFPQIPYVPTVAPYHPSASSSPVPITAVVRRAVVALVQQVVVVDVVVQHVPLSSV